MRSGYSNRQGRIESNTRATDELKSQEADSARMFPRLMKTREDDGWAIGLSRSLWGYADLTMLFVRVKCG